MTISPTMRAHNLLASLKVGDKVTLSGSNLIVTREIHHQDGTGAWESYGVTVGTGTPGGYSTFVSASAISAGFKTLVKNA